MEARRKQKGEIQYHELQRQRSYNKKPPLACWQPTVPAWEKKFCSSVGLVPWKKILETKRFMHLYDNVVQWNDSAVEEAFNNAKSRYWAAINGLPCNISLPDPDTYIDEIDWDSEVNPELILDLEREPEDLAEVDKGDNGVILCNSLLLNQTFSCTGWGTGWEDTEEEPKKNSENCDWNMGNHENSWEQVYAPNKEAPVDNDWGNCPQKSSWNTWENNDHEWNNNYRESSNKDYGRGGYRGTWDGNRRRREGYGSHTSKLKTSRFRGDDNQMDRGLRNGRWRKRGVVCA
ncbi:uncharacterized protein LOC110809505 [Carica papaya]|uniref:uncharacterized protein LOC110809505 n=1 Tax=Carica papaya TaxID=3649 RepID=UPI000B8C8BC1|nr:uncharacterized protein LOC110809505 [Carica papaya]